MRKELIKQEPYLKHLINGSTKDTITGRIYRGLFGKFAVKLAHILRSALQNIIIIIDKS